MRLGHYLKGTTSQATPTDAIWLDTETEPTIDESGSERHRLVMGSAAYRRTYAKGKWTEAVYNDFTTIDGCWDWVESKLHGKCKLYVFAHNWAFDYLVLDGFRQMLARGWTLESAVIESPPIYLKYRRNKQTIMIVDTLNIWRMSLKQLGASIGLPKLEMPAKSATSEDWHTYNRRDTDIIMSACMGWWDFIKENQLGGFAPTLAGQAFRTFRHRFMVDQILIDSDEDALSLARDAMHGGRTEAWQIGSIDTAVYRLDINSMYPDIMAKQLMPTKLAGVYKRVSTKELASLLEHYCLIADVIVETDKPAYGLINDNRLVFPVGRFSTVLSTPELIYALDHNHIKSCHQCVVYHRSYIFTDYVDYFYTLRKEYIAAGNHTQANQCKLMLNSLYGKFGQNGRRYDIQEQVDSDEVKTWTEYDAETKEIASYRQFGGIIQRFVNEGESRDSHPAIAGHVTAHARMRLWADIERIGYNDIYYMDTDSIWTNERGFETMINHVDPNTLGAYKLEGIEGNVIIHGAKDYQYGATKKIKGIRQNAVQIDVNTYEQVKFRTLKGALRCQDLTAPIVSTITKRLSRRYTKGQLQDDGRVLPLRFSSSGV